MLRQAFEEAVHTHTFQYICTSLGLDQGELFNMYREVPSITGKDAWALQFTQTLEDPSFRPAPPEADQAFLRDLVAFYVIFEGMWFYTGVRADPLARPAEQDGRHRRAMPVHPAGRIHPPELRD